MTTDQTPPPPPPSPPPPPPSPPPPPPGQPGEGRAGGENPGAWGRGAWSSAVVETDHPRTVVTLVLGIASIMLGLSCYGLGFLLGPIAWRQGHRVLAEIDRSPGVYRNRNLANAGRICGIVATALLGVAIVALVVVVNLRG